MNKYIYKDGKILQDVTHEVRMSYPKITIIEPIYNDVTEEYMAKVNKVLVQVEPKVKKRANFATLIESYTNEMVKLDEEVKQIIEYHGIDKELVKAVDAQKASMLGF